MSECEDFSKKSLRNIKNIEGDKFFGKNCLTLLYLLQPRATHLKLLNGNNYRVIAYLKDPILNLEDRFILIGNTILVDRIPKKYILNAAWLYEKY